jgi:hypothetical protein
MNASLQLSGRKIAKVEYAKIAKMNSMLRFDIPLATHGVTMVAKASNYQLTEGDLCGLKATPVIALRIWLKDSKHLCVPSLRGLCAAPAGAPMHRGVGG